jgi:hypothetical protein
MKQDIKNNKENNYGKAIELEDSISQKYISFLNRYFIFKKVKNVNAENIKNSFLGSTGELEEEKEELETIELQEKIRNQTKKVKKVSSKKTKPRLTKKKLILKQ